MSDARPLAADRWVVDGNREPLTGIFRWQPHRSILRWQPHRSILRWQPHRSILRWAWTTHAKVRDRYAAAIGDPVHTHLRFVRLRSRAEVRSWLTEVVPARG